MLIDRIQLRPADREEVEDDPQDQAPIVKPKRPSPESLAERIPVGGDIAQAEIDQPDAEKAEGAEQRRMGVVEGQERAVLVVIDQRRIQRAAAKDAGADEIPERGADDVGVGETVFELAIVLDQRRCWIASMISSTSGSTSINENIVPIGTHKPGSPAQ